MFAEATRSSSGNAVMGVAPHLLAGDARAQSSLLSGGFIAAANLTMGTSPARCAVLAATSRTMEVLCWVLAMSLGMQTPVTGSAWGGGAVGGGACQSVCAWAFCSGRRVV